MKRRSDTFLMILAGLVVAVVIGAVGFQMVTDQSRTAAVAKLKPPPAIAKFKEGGGAKTAAPVQGERRESGGAQPKSAERSESIAGFTEVFKRANAVTSDKHWMEKLNDVLIKQSIREWTEEDWRDAKAIMAGASDVMSEIRRLANAGGPAIELDWSKGYAMELPHLAQLRSCARLLKIDAAVCAHNGDYKGAVDDIVATMKLGAVVGNEPILISQLVRIAIDGVAYETAQEALPSEGLSPDLTRSLIAYVGHQDTRQNFADCYSGEAFFGLEAFDQMREGNAQSFISSNGASPTEIMFMNVYGSVLARPWLNMDEEAYAETMAEIQEASRLPYYEAALLMEQVNRDIESLPITRVWSRQILPALPRAIEAQARDEAMLQLMRVGLSVELYRAENGSYPVSLDALTPTLGGSLPIDPYTGQPLVYRTSGEGFVLYSAGQNRVDDGGQQNYRENDSARPDYQTGDLVWRAQPNTSIAN